MRRNIGIACAIGSIVTVLLVVAFALSQPALVSLGLLGGFAAGYLSFEFRETLHAAGRALRQTLKGGFVMVSWARGIVRFAGAAFIELVSPDLIMSTLLALAFAIGILPLGFPVHVNLFVMFFGSWIIFSFSLSLSEKAAEIGAKHQGFRMKSAFGDPLPHTDKRLLCRVTYVQVFTCYCIALKLLAARLPIGVLKGTFWVLSAPFRFVWMLVRLIHSNKRLMCGVDGVLGGIIALAFIPRASDDFGVTIAIGLVGSIIGAALGIFNFEILSKKVFRLA